MGRIFRQLTITDRRKIEKMYLSGEKAKDMADTLRVNVSTIYRELKRGRYMHRNSDWTETERYSADIAEEKYQENLKAKGPVLKIGKDIEPTMSVSKIVNLMKSYTTYHIWKRYPNYLRKHFWKEHTFWTDGYFACSVGNVSEEMLKKYIENQG